MQMRINRFRQYYYVPNWQSWMAPPLTATLVRYEKPEGNRFSRKQDPVKYKKPLYCEDDKGGALFLAGMLDEFLDVAKEHGYEIEIVDSRNPNPNNLVPNVEQMPADLRYKQDQVLDALMKNDKGLITCNTGFGKSFCCRVLCELYPTAKIVITTSARSVVEDIYKSLVKSLGANTVGKLCAGTPSCEENKRVLIATNRSLLRAPLETCDFLLFDEVHHLGDNQVFQQLIERCHNCRMFGFSASPTRSEERTVSKDKTPLMIKSLFGRVLATCTYQEAVAHNMVTPIHADMPEFHSTRTIQLADDLVTNKRRFYWRNTERNRFIAQQAAAIPDNLQTLITVETLEHAILLKQQPELKDWPIIHSGKVQGVEKKFLPYSYDTAPDSILAKRKADDFVVELFKTAGEYGTRIIMPGFTYEEQGEIKYVSFKDARYNFVTVEDKPIGSEIKTPVKIAGEDASKYHMSSKQVDQLISDFDSAKVKKAIATTVIKEGVNFYHLTVLIRAEGATSDVVNTQITGRLSRILSDKPFAVLIDPFDTDNDWVRGRSIARRRIYKEKGWLDWAEKKN